MVPGNEVAFDAIAHAVEVRANPQHACLIEVHEFQVSAAVGEHGGAVHAHANVIAGDDKIGGRDSARDFHHVAVAGHGDAAEDVPLLGVIYPVPIGADN